MGEFEKAIEYYHKSLSYNDDILTNDLLIKAIKNFNKKYLLK
jgi:hypothetical protein